MNVEYLKTFLVVAESENFTDAAKILHKTQPAISLQIKSLEDHYDCLLFERTKRKLILTQAGKIFQAYAEDILHKFNALDNEINKLLNNLFLLASSPHFLLNIKLLIINHFLL